MNSGSHRGFTVVTIMTLVFTPVFSHHNWLYQLVSKTSETKTVPCVVQQPCPSKSTVVNVVTLERPQDPPPSGDDGGNSDGGQDGHGDKNGADNQGGSHGGAGESSKKTPPPPKRR